MATEFKKLSEVTKLEEAAETAYVLVEENGEIYRVPKTAVGGAGGIKTAIIRDSNYLDAIAGVSGYTALAVSYECTNMTFDEAYDTMEAGEPLAVLGMLTGEGGMNVPGISVFLGTSISGVKTIGIVFTTGPSTELFWTANGISTERPGGDK